jgi:hypothetical protein
MSEIILDEARAFESLMQLAKSVYPQDTPPNTFNMGTLAAAIKMISSSMVETGVMASIVARESRENTMIMPQSIYALARYNQLPISLAKPASVDVLLLLPLTYFNNKDTIRIQTSDVGAIGRYPVIPIHDVVIDRSSGTFVAYYDVDIPTVYPEPVDPNCQVFNTNVDGRAFIGVIVKMIQVKREVVSLEMISTDTTQRTAFDIDYSNQLAGHVIYYDSAGTSLNTDVALKPLVKVIPAITNTDALAIQNQPSIYINYLTDNSIRMSFTSSENNFRPRIGSSIYTVLYTTQGATIGTTTNDMQVKIVVADINRPVTGRTVTSLIGGVNRKTLAELKIDALNNGMLRETLATDRDIEQAIANKLQELTTNTNTKLQLRKSREDIEKRTWSATTALRGPDGLMLPTITTNIKTTLEELQNLGWNLPVNMPVIYDNRTDTYRLMDEDEPLPLVLDNNTPIYVIPFATGIQLDPPRMELIQSSINEHTTLNYRIGNSSVTRISMLATALRIQRDSAREQRYTISVKGAYVDSEVQANYRALMILHDGSQAVGWKEFTDWNAGLGVFMTHIDTADKFNITTKKYILNGLRNFLNGNAIPETEIGENLWCEIVLLAPRSEVGNAMTFNVSPSSPLYINTLANRWTQISENTLLADYIPLVVYTTPIVSEYPVPVGTVSFWKNLTNTTNYDMAISTTGVVTLFNVPLVHASYLTTQTRVAHFNKSIGDLMDILSKIRNLLHNNTNIELHFINTHGVSKRTTAHNLALRISLKLRMFREPTSAELKQIKQEIVNFIESANDQQPIRPIAFSNLSTKLEKKFEIIKSIEMISLGDDVRQIIEGANTNLPNLRPEYLSVARNPNITDDDFNPDITIEIV